MLSEDQELPFLQRLSKEVNYLLINRDVLQPYCSSLYHIPYIVIYNLNMLGPVMEHVILWKSDPTLIVIVYHSHIQYLFKQLSKELPKQYYLTDSHASNNVLNLRCAKGNKLLLPVHPIYHGRPRLKQHQYVLFLLTMLPS